MLQMILQILNMILHLSQVQILINIYNMPQHLLSMSKYTGCKYSSVSCVSNNIYLINVTSTTLVMWSCLCITLSHNSSLLHYSTILVNTTLLSTMELFWSWMMTLICPPTIVVCLGTHYDRSTSTSFQGRLSWACYYTSIHNWVFLIPRQRCACHLTIMCDRTALILTLITPSGSFTPCIDPKTKTTTLVDCPLLTRFMQRWQI